MRRSITAVPLLALAIGLPFAAADPRDPFTMALPSRDTKPPEGIAAKQETHSVVEQQGTASHSIPIEVPPGRLGMQPNLALSYSSGGSLRGGIAVGWSLDVPVIERDPAFTTTVNYRSSLGGGWQRLIPNTSDPGSGNRYRAEVDSTFQRYRLDPGTYQFIVSGSDGVVRTFAQHEPLKWRLVSEKDPFGNEVTYSYTFATTAGFGEFVLSEIQYSSNAAAGIVPHAKVQLTWDPNVPVCGGIAVGASTDYHFNTRRASGIKRLQKIETSVRVGGGTTFRVARRYSLGYDTAEESCSASALRYLTRVDVSAFAPSGTETVAPPITFNYGAKRPAFASTMTLPSVGWSDVGKELGPTRALIDMDGDGLVDRVEMKTGQKCRLEWRKGTAPGQFSSTVNAQALPTARWREGDNPLPDEYCTLSGQKVIRDFHFGYQACTYWTINVNYNLIDIDADGRVDVLTSLNEPHLGDAGGDFAQWSGVSAIAAGNSNGGCPIGSTAIEGGGCTATAGCTINHYRDPWLGVCKVNCSPTEQCGGAPDPSPAFETCAIVPPLPERNIDNNAFVWRVQRQLGTGAIAAINSADFWTFHAPKALTPNGSEATLDGFPRPNLPRLTDIDGDGYLDLIELPRWSTGSGIIEAVPGQCSNVDAGSCAIKVWPGLNFAGQGSIKTFGTQQLWNQSPHSIVQNATTEQNISGTAQISSPNNVAFRDVNADGLPDMIVQSYGQNLAVAYNMAGSVGPGSTFAGAFSAPVSMGFVSQVELSRAEVGWNWRLRYLYSGQRASVKRLVDVDNDGFVEQLSFTPGASVIYPSTQRRMRRLYGGGGAAGLDLDLGSEYEAGEGLITATAGGWRRMSDIVDLTGDGQPDLVTWGVDGSATLRTDHGAATPARLLESINNGRGGVIRFEYASSNDATVMTPGVQPLGPRFLVKRIVESPGFGQPDLRTSYRYATPVSGRNSPIDPDAPGFLGFTEVTIDRSGQQGDGSSRTVRTYSYAQYSSDWRGVLAEELTYLKQGTAYAPVKHVSYTYGSGTLSGTSASVTYRTSTAERTCYVGTPDWFCKVQPTPVKTTTDTWIPKYLAGAGPQLYVKSETVSSDLITAPRYVRSWYLPLNGPTDFRVFTTSEESGMVSSGNYVQMGFTTTLFDWNQKYLPIETRVYRDASNYVSTKRTFDVATGVQTTQLEPNQVAGTQVGSKVFTYDGYKLYIVNRLDEHSRSTQETYDLATGAVLSRVGPSWRFVPAAVCDNPYWCMDQVFDVEQWVIDGFGRVTSHLDSIDRVDGGFGYQLTPVEWFTYNDVSLPNKKTQFRLRDASTSAAVIDEAQYDGLGRVIKSIAHRQLTAQCNPETRHAYDAGGALLRIDSPDPRSTSCATVATTYQRDGLGRMTAMQRPDGSSETVTYDGLVTTSQQLSSDGAGEKTAATSNMHGELVRVQELDNPGIGQIATTTYAYDPFGRMSSIVDADGNVTTLGYDWRGLRTSVTRGTRTWTYGYDATGNLVSQTEPFTTGTVADYTSVTKYNALNQAIQYTPAKRGMTPERLAELGIGEVYVAWDAFGPVFNKPNAITTTLGQTMYYHDALGNPIKERRTTNLAGVSLVQVVERQNDLLGNSLRELWDDGTEWRYTYDHRGAVDTVQWKDPANGSFVEIANYDRRPAGQPYQRTSAFGPQRDWSYDVMGRVIYDHVFHANTGANLHERTYGYDGAGEVRMISGVTGGQPVDATYNYDRRHRLTSADGPVNYEASFTYSGAGNVRTANVSGALDAPDRRATYAYGAVDPQATDRLTDSTTGATLASFTYDRAGNMTARSTPQGSFEFAWGADGYLREVSGPEGRERYYFGLNGERIASVGPGGIKLWFGSSETRLNLSGVLQHRYHHIATGEPIARVIDRTQIELQFADAMQNLAITTSRTGALTSSFVYGAFGELVHSNDASASHTRLFNGKEHDAVSGLRHYGYRSYDPYTLRWVSGDPLFRFRPDAAWAEPQEANLYAFSLNNPNRYVDPDGRRNGDVRSWSGDTSKNGTPAAKTDEAKCPEKKTCQVDVVHQRRIFVSSARRGRLTILKLKNVQVRASATVIDGKVQSEVANEVHVLDEYVMINGKSVTTHTEETTETGLQITPYTRGEGSTLVVGMSISGGSRSLEFVDNFEDSLDVSHPEAVFAPALGFGKGSSHGQSFETHSTFQESTFSRVNVKTVGAQQWSKIATERVEGPFVGR
ncbi:MAG: hypothetical protein JNL83_24905 [Myxococcales bacterium]|nr:hypothetical protein [Myxococcales bacterium]